MALTFTNLDRTLLGNKWRVTGDLAITSGGGTVTAAALGMDTVEEFMAESTGGYVFQYVPSTGVLSALYGDYDAGVDGALIANTSASVSNIPFTAVGY